MNYKSLFIITGCIAFICLVSCMEHSNDTAAVQAPASGPDTAAFERYIQQLDKGAIVFKNNCARCHCGPSSSCEGINTLLMRFIHLPADSMNYFVGFIRDSKSLANHNKEPNDKSAGDNYQHQFKGKLNEEELHDVIWYAWAGFHK